MLGRRLGMGMFLPFTLIFALPAPMLDNGARTFAFVFADGVTLTFAHSFTTFALLLAPFIIGALALLAIATLLVAPILILGIVFVFGNSRHD
jgi:hypothetical protein